MPSVAWQVSGRFGVMVFACLLALGWPDRAWGQEEAGPRATREGGQGTRAQPTTPSGQASAPAVAAASAWIVAVLPPKIGDSASGPLSERFRKAACQSFGKAGHLVVSDERTSTVLLSRPLWTECRAGSCLEELASALKADFLVFAEVRRDEVGKNYEYEMRLLDAMGRVRWTDRGRCDICTLNEGVAAFAALAAKAAAALGPKPRPPEPRCPPSCGPGRTCRAGRCVTIPRKPARKARKQRPRPARPARKAARPVRSRKRPGRTRPRWIAKPPWGQFALVVAGVAVAAAVTGGVLLGLHDEPTCSRSRPEVTCPERYDTRAAGIGFLTVSALGVAGSAVLGYLWWRHRGESPKSRRVDLQVTGLGARVTWRF